MKLSYTKRKRKIKASPQLSLDLKVNYTKIVADYKQAREAYFASVGK